MHLSPTSKLGYLSFKSRVLYPDLGFISSATWPSLPKKQHNGLINQSIIFFLVVFFWQEPLER